MLIMLLAQRAGRARHRPAGVMIQPNGSMALGAILSVLVLAVAVVTGYYVFKTGDTGAHMRVGRAVAGTARTGSARTAAHRTTSSSAPATIARPRVSVLARASSSSIAAWSWSGRRRGGAGW